MTETAGDSRVCEAELREALDVLLDRFEAATDAGVATVPVIVEALAARGVELPPWLFMLTGPDASGAA